MNLLNELLRYAHYQLKRHEEKHKCGYFANLKYIKLCDDMHLSLQTMLENPDVVELEVHLSELRVQLIVWNWYSNLGVALELGQF